MKMDNKIYIHDIPGRLRIRTEAIKRSEHAAAAVQELLHSTAGVLSAVANPLTGSITVTYDVSQLSSTSILELLRERGYLATETEQCERAAVPVQPSFASTLLMEVAAPKLGKMILGWTIEQALSAAVAALL